MQEHSSVLTLGNKILGRISLINKQSDRDINWGPTPTIYSEVYQNRRQKGGMEILADSGATINIMAGSLAKDIGIKFQKSPEDNIVVLDAQTKLWILQEEQ